MRREAFEVCNKFWESDKAEIGTAQCGGGYFVHDASYTIYFACASRSSSPHYIALDSGRHLLGREQYPSETRRAQPGTKFARCPHRDHGRGVYADVQAVHSSWAAG